MVELKWRKKKRPRKLLSSITGVEAVARIRATAKRVPVLFFVSRSSKVAPAELEQLQNLLVTSNPEAPEFIAPDDRTVARIVEAHLARAEKQLIATAKV